MPLTTVQWQILEAMLKLGRPATLGEISDSLGRSAVLTYKNLNDMYDNGRIVKIEKDKLLLFELTPNARRLLGRARREKGALKKGDALGNRYALEACVGRGTYGEVWRAKDNRLDRTVAVKLLHGGKKDYAQLKKEGKALSPLTHKNIVVVHDLGSDEDNGWLVTEFVEGQSLQEYLISLSKDGKWCSFDEVKDIIQRVLEALEFAHEKSRVHGDIKPGNILMPKTGEIKLGDFGVAKILDGSTEDIKEYDSGRERRLGSASYAAPEVLNGQPRDFQSDLFSVGILAYVLMTGKHPFLHGSGLVPASETIQNEAHTPLDPRKLMEDLPEKYTKIVMRLLERDKSKRYKTAREVLDEWREKVESVRCTKCNADNPVPNRFCGQCGNDLRAIKEAESQPEKDLFASYLLFNAGQTREAISLIRASLDRNPKFAEGWISLGYMLNFERLYEDAESVCTRAIEIDPNLSRAYQTRGFARSNLGRFDPAIADFTDALDRETDDRRKSMILYQRGYAKKLAGRFDEAYQDAIEAVELDNTNVKAETLLKSLEPLLKTRE